MSTKSTREGILHSSRRITAPALGARIETDALIHPRYRLHAVHLAGVVSEDFLMFRAFERAGHSGRPVVTVLLEGARAHHRVRPQRVARGRRGPGDGREGRHRHAARASVRVAGPRVGRRVARAAPVPFARGDVGAARADLHAVWRSMREGASEPSFVRTVAQAARAAGIQVEVPSDDALREPLDEQLETLCRALDACVSALDGQPMVADLEERLGLSARQVNRLVAQFNARYGFNAGGWRDLRNRRRLMMGAALMTAEGATGEYVARVVGYRSAAAFSRALTDMGFPPPSAIAEAVRALGERGPG